MDILLYSACFVFFFFIFSKASIAKDKISPSESLTDGMTLVSDGGSFELGFFSPGNSKNRYLGIWYNNIPMQTVVWVANRANPVNGTNGTLKISSSGEILVLDQNQTPVWSNNSTGTFRNPTLQLLDSGNLVVRDGDSSENYLWESFDYPTDTLLPGMKLGYHDLRTGFQRRLTAWKNQDDPSPGDFTFGVELQGYPELVLRKGIEKYSRCGLWNGDGNGCAPNLRYNPIFEFEVVWNDEKVYYIFSLRNKSKVNRLVLNQTEMTRQRYSWEPETQTWKLFSFTPNDYCDRFGICGPNGNCDQSKIPACECLKGFSPKSPERWNSSDWHDGCIHTKPLNCSGGDGFLKTGNVKTPDSPNSWVNDTMNLKECEARCLHNCSCMAYTNLNARKGGNGCVMWFGDLIDIKQQQLDGQDIYIRVSASEATATATGTSLFFALIYICIPS